MTAPDPRLEEIEAKLRGAESYGYPSFMLATAHVAYLLAELRKARHRLARVEAECAATDTETDEALQGDLVARIRAAAERGGADACD